MPRPADRLTLLLGVHGDSYRSAAERCGLDHTTLMRVARRETENPVTLAKIAEGYGVPMAWLRGERDLETDFACAVLACPLEERVQFLWERDRRFAYAITFLRQYDPEKFTSASLAELLQVPESHISGVFTRGTGLVAGADTSRLCSATGLPKTWFCTGLVGREDEAELLAGLAAHTLTNLAQVLKIDVTKDEIWEAANALV